MALKSRLFFGKVLQQSALKLEIASSTLSIVIGYLSVALEVA